MDHHFSDDDLDRLLGQELNLAAAPPGSDSAHFHAQSCPACREQLEELRSFARLLRSLPASAPTAPLAGCPEEDVWLRLAARLVPATEIDPLLDHAIGCDTCALRFHEALADLAVPATPAEQSVLAALPTASPAWQSALARRLRESAAPPAISFWRRALHPPLLFAWTGLALCLLIVTSWFVLRSARRTGADALLAEAYTEQRTIEPRIGLTPWSPVRQQRGASAGARMGRTALLRAEAEIASHLRRDPEDVTWLDASGRAAMLEDSEDSIEAAVVTLEKASRLAPDNAQVSTDLASAYLLRAEFLNRPEDAALAVELLGKVLATDPGSETAVFNYALALEKLQLRQKAVTAWNAFLQRFPSSSWCGEARQHRDVLQGQVASRLQRSRAPLAGAAAFAAMLDADSPASLDDLDARAEEYGDLALAVWLPSALDAASRAGPVPEDRALAGLARLFVDRHGDPWLQDILASLHASPSATPAFRSLALAAATVETSDDIRARTAAEQARNGFTRAGIVPGRLRAELYLTHLDQYAHRNADCERRAQDLLHNPALGRYPWMRTDALLEAAFCSRIGGGAALGDVQSSLSLAERHNFSTLQLRARAAESGLYTTLGDEHRAWASASASLAAWWNDSAPLLRGYNALITMDEIHISRPRWFLESALLEEALPLVAGDPRTTMVAVATMQLAQARIHTGDAAGASAGFDSTALLIGRSATGPERDFLSAEVELGLARVELVRNQPASAAARLERIRSRFLAIANNRLLVDFYQTSATANLRAGQTDRAGQDLRAGIALDQASLAQIQTDAERLSWTRLHEPLYRDLVELELRRDPVHAFAVWQESRGAVVRASLHLPAANPVPAPAGEARVSYFQMPAGIYIWVQSGDQLRGRFVPIADSGLRSLSANLLERCSDPAASDQSWRPLAARLYSLLIAPVEPWLAGSTHLVIEPDGPLKQLPFALLLDPRGTLLADRFSISISPGTDYLRAARSWTGISSASRALVVGDAFVRGWAPLPEVDTEVHAVAASFRRADVVTGAAPADFSRRLADAQVFHFSGHAEASPSAVALIQSGNDAALPLDFDALRRGRGQLVVLSACSTAQGATGLFDDSDSPVQQLLAARLPAVVASRWNVDSAATTQLMRAFYAALLAGARPSRALQQAARAVRAQPLFTHPYYWASFTVYGQD